MMLTHLFPSLYLESELIKLKKKLHTRILNRNTLNLANVDIELELASGHYGHKWSQIIFRSRSSKTLVKYCNDWWN
jgi:hypothetical protein